MTWTPALPNCQVLGVVGLSRSAAALAAPGSRGPKQNDQRQWLMLTAQLFGTGRQWRPLDQALEVLWQAGAWREELIQLLELLAERPLKQPQRRLHPLPWALPVPLRVHGRYSRAEIMATLYSTRLCAGEAPAPDRLNLDVVHHHQAAR